MSVAGEERDIQTLFSTGWPPTVQIAWPNVGLDVTNLEEWVRFNIVRSGGYHAGMGDEKMFNRYLGIVDIQVFTKPGTGTKRALELADVAAGIFLGVQVNGISFSVPGVDMQDVVDGWYQVNVTCTYYRNECESRG